MANGVSSALKDYDYLLKFLLVGDSDVGKDEILSRIDAASEEDPCTSSRNGNKSYCRV